MVSLTYRYELRDPYIYLNWNDQTELVFLFRDTSEKP